MATIDLNNLIRPKKVNSTNTVVTQQVQNPTPVYVDLHLDLDNNRSIGIGGNPAIGNDIIVDQDILAIKNSIRNLFTTKRGEKVLNPEFGCSLDAFLFEAVTEMGGKAIGDTIYNAITRFEPRVEVLNVYVQTNPDSSPMINYNGNQLTATIKSQNSNQPVEIGPGYAITVIYQFLEIKKQDAINIIAQIGGQILI
jgi:phage baseplate assembly protein W